MIYWEGAVQLAEYLSGIFALLGTVLGVFLAKLIEWFNRPKLEVKFEYGEPCLFLGRYFRLKVINKGRSAARNCVAKFSFTEVDREDWREGEMLHWTRHDPSIYRRDPERVDEIYSPITIAKGDYELLDVFYLETGAYHFVSGVLSSKLSKRPKLHLYSFPAFEGSSRWPKVSSTTNLERYKIKEATVYKGKVAIYCDNGGPETFLLYFKFENGRVYVGKHPEHLNPVKQYIA